MPYTSDWSILSKVKKARILTTCFFTLDKIDFLMEVARGGKGASQKAAVAVARKLAVLLHKLWVTGDDYHPFYPKLKETVAQ